jgi:hypothetical protein
VKEKREEIVRHKKEKCKEKTMYYRKRNKNEDS